MTTDHCTGLFDVDDVKNAAWDETPYEKLVLPGGEKEKELILGFAKHRSNIKGFDDFVKQKGENDTPDGHSREISKC